MEKAMTIAGVSQTMLVDRMRLPVDAAEMAEPQQYGSALVWVVLYRSIFSLVTFTAGNVAACIAPGCRRFRGRCGHVKIARPAHQARKDALPEETATGFTRKGAKVDNAPAEPRPFIDNEHEDVGIEKLRGDTGRAKSDAKEAKLSKRMARNMLPCAGEIDQGDVWMRTADWRAVYLRRARGAEQSKAENLKKIMDIFQACASIGHVVDSSRPLFESCCGSCGCRWDGHALTKEPGLLYTHHPTAPAIKVSVRCGGRL